jgi:hypothetical protein
VLGRADAKDADQDEATQFLVGGVLRVRRLDVADVLGQPLGLLPERDVLCMTLVTWP